MGIKFLDANGSGTTADAIAAVEFAIAVKQAFAARGGANIRVLSNSWGGPDFSQALLDEVNAANAADMLVVAGAGNDSFDNDLLPFYPASFDAPNVVAVAATTRDDDLAWFSNYGASSVHLGAPGEDILSTTIGNTYAFMSGTSMATPHVSGAAALVLSRCDLDTAALKDTLLGSVDPLPSLTSITISGGRVNVNNALHACTAPPDTADGSDRPRVRDEGDARLVRGARCAPVQRQAQPDARWSLRDRRLRRDEDRATPTWRRERYDVLLRRLGGERAGRERRLRRGLGHAVHSARRRRVVARCARVGRGGVNDRRHGDHEESGDGSASSIDDAALSVGRLGAQRVGSAARRGAGRSCACRWRVEHRNAVDRHSGNHHGRYALPDRQGRRR